MAAEAEKRRRTTAMKSKWLNAEARSFYPLAVYTFSYWFNLMEQNR